MPDFSTAQVGFAIESTYGTPNTPTRGLEVAPDGFDMMPVYADIPSAAVKTGYRFKPKGRTMRYTTGAAGTLKQDVSTAGFGYWLKMMFGAIAIVDNTTYRTMTATPASTKGVQATMERVVPFDNETGEFLWRFAGVKCAEWTLKCDKKSLLQAELKLDARSTQTTLDSITKGTLVYPTTEQLLYFTGATISIDGGTVCAQGFELTGNNNLDTGKDGLCSNGLKDEPTAVGATSVTAKVPVRFESSTYYAKYIASPAASRETVLSMVFQSPAFIVGSTYGSLQIDIPIGDMMGDPPNALSGSQIETLTFDVLQGPSGTPITATYKTLDSIA